MPKPTKPTKPPKPPHGHPHHDPPDYEPPPPPDVPCEDLRLEAVTVCVGFDDMLDVTLGLNHPHFDNFIVVTSHADKKTHAVCQKYGAMCVMTDLFNKNGRKFNKGAAINAGFGYYQYNGWRMHLDADIIVPDNFRRILFNHTPLNKNALFGADRVDVIGVDEVHSSRKMPQHRHRLLVDCGQRPMGARFVSTLHGYLPLGFFQLWHAQCHKPYPYSLGTAAHDDTMFAALWPAHYRIHLPQVVCQHLCSCKPVWGENWDGKRQHPRLPNR